MDTTNSVLRVGLPKGRMQTKVVQLLADAGLPVSIEEREYRPRLGNGFSLKTQAGQLSYETKLLKPQNIVEMLSSGSRDVGFAGADWVRELKADLVELLDTGMDPVSVVVAAPERLVKLIGEAGTPRTPWNKACGRNPIVASEYESLAREWMAEKLPEGVFIRSYGATEVFPPEDADIIIDNCATGSTLRANGR